MPGINAIALRWGDDTYFGAHQHDHFNEVADLGLYDEVPELETNFGIDDYFDQGEDGDDPDDEFGFNGYDVDLPHDLSSEEAVGQDYEFALEACWQKFCQTIRDGQLLEGEELSHWFPAPPAGTSLKWEGRGDDDDLIFPSWFFASIGVNSSDTGVSFPPNVYRSINPRYDLD